MADSDGSNEVDSSEASATETTSHAAKGPFHPGFSTQSDGSEADLSCGSAMTDDFFSPTAREDLFRSRSPSLIPGASQSPGLFCPDRITIPGAAIQDIVPMSMLTPGTPVWCASPEEVLNLLGHKWDPFTNLVAGGLVPGKVVRTSTTDDYLYVGFDITSSSGANSSTNVKRNLENGLKTVFLTLPRFVLSLEPIERINDACTGSNNNINLTMSRSSGCCPFTPNRSVLYREETYLGPRAGHDKKVAKRPPQPLVSDVDVKCTLGQHIEITSRVIKTIQEGKVDEAMDIMNGAAPVVQHSCAALVHMIQGQGNAAQIEAKAAIEAVPDEVTAQLRLWHASVMLGKPQQARDTLSKVKLLLPQFEHMEELETLTIEVQKHRDTVLNHLKCFSSNNVQIHIQLDYNCRRYCVLKSPVRSGDLILSDRPLLLAATAEFLKYICDCCGKPEVTIPAQQETTPFLKPWFCTQKCRRKAWETYLQSEVLHFPRGFGGVRSLIKDGRWEAASPLTIRIIAIVIQKTHKLWNASELEGGLHLARLNGSSSEWVASHRSLPSSSCDVPSSLLDDEEKKRRQEGLNILHETLRDAGLYPLLDCSVYRLEPGLEYKLQCAYRVLSATWPSFLKAVLPADTFYSIFLSARKFGNVVSVSLPFGQGRVAVLATVSGALAAPQSGSIGSAFTAEDSKDTGNCVMRIRNVWDGSMSRSKAHNASIVAASPPAAALSTYPSTARNAETEPISKTRYTPTKPPDAVPRVVRPLSGRSSHNHFSSPLPSTTAIQNNFCDKDEISTEITEEIKLPFLDVYASEALEPGTPLLIKSATHHLLTAEAIKVERLAENCQNNAPL